MCDLKPTGSDVQTRSAVQSGQTLKVTPTIGPLVLSAIVLQLKSASLCRMSRIGVLNALRFNFWSWMDLRRVGCMLACQLRQECTSS